jgi:hypothetical protein
MTLNIDENLRAQKTDVLDYFRGRADEIVVDVTRALGQRHFKKVVGRVNRDLAAERTRLEETLRQAAKRQSWPAEVLLESLLMIKHCANVCMIEARNSVWPYEYMSFSRRVGELWEALCTTCFENAPRADLLLFAPPVFADVRRRLQTNMRDFIFSLSLSDKDKTTLLDYYDKAWTLVDAGEIKLALDMHFVLGSRRYVVDFKSGFGSNEKGNTNRLLLVASVYKNVAEEDYSPVILVRSQEDESNHYLQRLKNSGLWEVHCGAYAYNKIHEYTHYDLRTWIDENIDWRQDILDDTWSHLECTGLTKYLAW